MTEFTSNLSLFFKKEEKKETEHYDRIKAASILLTKERKESEIQIKDVSLWEIKVTVLVAS